MIRKQNLEEMKTADGVTTRYSIGFVFLQICLEYVTAVTIL